LLFFSKYPVPSGLNRAQWLRPSAVSNRAFRVAATNIITIIIIVVVVEVVVEAVVDAAPVATRR
jgi:hypothetical protein